MAWKLIMNWELSFESEDWKNVSFALKCLLMGMLDKDPMFRLKISDVLIHPWMTGELSNTNSSLIMPKRRKTNESANSAIIQPVSRKSSE